MASAVNGKLENKSEVLKVEPLVSAWHLSDLEKLTLCRTTRMRNGRHWSSMRKYVKREVSANFPRITYRDPEGTEREWESSERLTRPAGCDIDGVNIVAILHDPSNPDESPRLLLQKQWRPPANSTVIEIPGGLIDPNESAETCALRELKEECGYEGEVVDDDFGVSPVMFNGKHFLGDFQSSFMIFFPSWTFKDGPPRQAAVRNDPAQRQKFLSSPRRSKKIPETL